MASTFSVASSGSSGSLLILLAASIVAVVLVGGFWYGSRRTRFRRSPAPAAHPDPVASGPAQRGQTWQTIDDDPEQGAPHRPARPREPNT